jgi:hypothetical protein
MMETIAEVYTVYRNYMDTFPQGSIERSATKHIVLSLWKQLTPDERKRVRPPDSRYGKPVGVPRNASNV